MSIFTFFEIFLWGILGLEIPKNGPIRRLFKLYGELKYSIFCFFWFFVFAFLGDCLGAFWIETSLNSTDL